MDSKTYRYILDKVKEYAGDDAEELLQTVLLQVYSKGLPKPNPIGYILRSCWKSYHSTSSPFATNKLNFIELKDVEAEYQEDEAYDIDKIIDAIYEMKDIPWWDGQVVLRKILEQKTFKELSEEYGVSFDKVVNVYYSTLRKIRKNIKIWLERN